MADKQKIFQLEKAAVEQLKTVYDPEIPVNIYDLGLIYKVDVKDDFSMNVIMTLTTPNCPVADSLPEEVKQKIEAIEGVNKADVELTFDPPWTKEMLSEEAMLELGLL
ncbi:MAG TPA: SUF system Fe-S cluster assembly protein [Bacteroidales bacterium]|nr:SUF system Fe-S cluster assembly protein [Bacteroidales bacterium]